MLAACMAHQQQLKHGWRELRPQDEETHSAETSLGGDHEAGMNVLDVLKRWRVSTLGNREGKDESRV